MDLMSSSAEYYEIKTLPTPINSNSNEMGPAFYKDGFVFCSSRDKGGAVVNIDAQTGEGFFENYYVSVQDRSESKSISGYTKPVKFENLNTLYHDGPLCFSADGNTVYLTRTNMLGKDDSGVRRSKIYYATKLKSSGWSEPKGLPCNSDEYSNMHPSLSPDGNTLYYVSDMKTGRLNAICGTSGNFARALRITSTARAASLCLRNRSWPSPAAPGRQRCDRHANSFGPS